MSQPKSAFTMRLRNSLAVAAIRFFGWLSLAANRRLGSLIGWLLVHLPNEHRRTTCINLSLCLPQLNQAERLRLEQQSLHQLGLATLEVAWVWRQPQLALQQVKRVDGGELLQQAVDTQRAVVILAPHLGCWELLNYWLSHHYPLHALYSPSGLEEVDRLVASSREAFDTTTHPANRRGMAGLIKALRQGKMTAILPDQVPSKRGDSFAPFFGQQAATAPLACRLIQQTDAAAFCCFAKRLADGEGFEIIIRPAAESIHSPDINEALAAMNQSMEALIREAPEQYLWSYKRFRRAVGQQANPYDG